MQTYQEDENTREVELSFQMRGSTSWWAGGGGKGTEHSARSPVRPYVAGETSLVGVDLTARQARELKGALDKQGVSTEQEEGSNGWWQHEIDLVGEYSAGSSNRRGNQLGSEAGETMPGAVRETTGPALIL